MARFPIALPPGLFRNGTEAQAAGRWYDANLARWYGAAVGPIGGWRARGTDTVTGAARAILPWKDNSTTTWIGIATHSNLFVSTRDGTLHDITPSGFTPGRVDAVAAGGYGSSTYGTGFYGIPRPDSSSILDATQCSLDNFGEDLVFISPDDGKLYQWTLNTADAAAAVSGAPTGTALVVTAEGFCFVLATTDPRTLSWCDQRDITTWTPAATNQAGDFTMQTQGRLMCGKVIQGGIMILTDQDAWVATYAPNNNVYDFDKKGDACGAISRQCLVSFDMQAAWMDQNCNFQLYNGYVQIIPCDVQDYIRQDINLLQASKIFASRIAAFNEIEWRYCSASSSEIDRCVVWNYKENTWNIGRATRLCASDKGGGFSYPVAVDAGGIVYDHEIGLNFDGAAPYVETGAITLGSGDNIMHVTQLYPDDQTLGDVAATFQVKNNKDDDYATFGPYALASQTDVRFCGRQVKVQFTAAAVNNWRVGTPVIEIIPGGQR